METSGTLETITGTDEQPSGNFVSQEFLQKQVVTREGGRNESFSRSPPASAGEKSAVSTPSRPEAAFADPGFQTVIEKLAVAWPLPDAVRSDLLAMLDELNRNEPNSADR